MQLFDTHTHFDLADFDSDRQILAHQAKQLGVEQLILIGILEQGFAKLLATQQQLNQDPLAPHAHLAPGLHPFYIQQHQHSDLEQLAHFLTQHQCLAIGEIGLDSFLTEHKHAVWVNKQQYFFKHQIDLARQHNKPILLHIRKSHAEALKLLKQQNFTLGGIAHAFSGGVEEAKALIKLGFKIGITGQVTNPQAKKLHRVITAVGLENLVLETDCPDMTPLCCQSDCQHPTRNTPANLIYVLQALAQQFNQPQAQVAAQVWKNSLQALHLA